MIIITFNQVMMFFTDLIFLHITIQLIGFPIWDHHLIAYDMGVFPKWEVC